MELSPIENRRNCQAVAYLRKSSTVLLALLCLVLIGSCIFASEAYAAKKNYVTSIDAPSSVSIDAGQSKTIKVKVKAKGSAKRGITVSQNAASGQVVSVQKSSGKNKGVTKLKISAQKVSEQSNVGISIETSGKNKSGKHLSATISVTVKPVAAGGATTKGSNGGEKAPAAGQSSESGSNIAGYIILYVILALIVAFIIFMLVRRQMRRSYVRKNSSALAELETLNPQFSERFVKVKAPGPFRLTTKSKSAFDHFDPEKNMFAIVKEEESLFRNVCDSLQSNADLYHEYETKSAQILEGSAAPEDLPGIFRSADKYLSVQEKVFDAKKLHAPVTDVRVDLYWSYTSPKGQNHYDASRVYRKADLDSILNDIDKATEYEQSSKYQRDLLTPSLRFEILKRDNYTCQICGRTQKEGAKLEVDHIVPVAKGGKTEPDNLQTLCWDCNRGKSDKDM